MLHVRSLIPTFNITERFLTQRMQDECLPIVGTRFLLGPDRGTVRWIGEVNGAKGLWLGVEWDDARRGKHSGIHEGIHYFSCRVENSGSFIRNTTKLSFGSSFLQALKARYVTEVASLTIEESSKQYGRKNLADIEVETPNLDALIQKSSQLHKLRVVGLSGFSPVRLVEEVKLTEDNKDILVARAIDTRIGETQGDIRSICPSIRSLDLSRSLLPSWLEVSKITSELSHLESLQLHFNRFSELCTNNLPRSNAFQKLKELRMDGSLVTWKNILTLSPFLPALELLQLSSNQISKLDGADSTDKLLNLRMLNLEDNLLDDWNDISRSLIACPNLQRLVLSSNEISSIPKMQDDYDCPSIQHVSLWNNPFSSWKDIENLNANVEGLKSTTLGGDRCTLTQKMSSRDLRLTAIARIRSLETMNNATISADERREAELYYLSIVSKEEEKDFERQIRHPRYVELCELHGNPTAFAPSSRATIDGTLRSKLLRISVHVSYQAPSSTPPYITTSTTNLESKEMEILITTPLRLLLGKLARQFQLKQGSKSISSVWALLSTSIDSTQIVAQQLRGEMRPDEEINDAKEKIVYKMDNLERDLRDYNFAQDDEIVLVIRE